MMLCDLGSEVTKMERPNGGLKPSPPMTFPGWKVIEQHAMSFNCAPRCTILNG